MHTLTSRSNCRGFTLIELSIVVMVSAILLVGMMKLFSAYSASLSQEKAKRTIANAQTVMARFYESEGRYPCPAAILPRTDANFGFEKCDLVPTAGARDSNGNGMADDGIIAGVLPFHAYKRDDDGFVMTDANGPIVIDLSGLIEKNEVLQASLVDPWGKIMSYAVTKSMTVKNTFDTYRGVIRVTDEFLQGDGHGRDTGGTDKNAHYAIVSHGFDQVGAVTSDTGNQDIPCNAAYTLEAQNCNGGNTFVSSLLNKDETTAATYFDDYIAFATRTPVALWSKMQVAGVTTDSIMTTSTGNVGIRTSNPVEKLEVGNTAAVVPSNPASVTQSTLKADRATMVSELCDTSGNCFAPQSLVNMGCSGGQYIREIKIVSISGVNQLKPVCMDLAFEPSVGKPNCDNAFSGSQGYMTGLYTDGTIVCGIRP